MTALVQGRAIGTLIQGQIVYLGIYIVILAIYISNNMIWIASDYDNMICKFHITILGLVRHIVSYHIVYIVLHTGPSFKCASSLTVLTSRVYSPSPFFRF